MMLKGKERSRGWGHCIILQLRQLRTCGHVARTVCTVGFRVSPAMTGTFECHHPLPTHCYTHDCHNKCKVLPSEGERERAREGWPYMHRLLPATCHLAPSAFFSFFFFSFFYNFWTSFSTIFPLHISLQQR